MDWSHVNRIAMLSVPDRLSIEIEKLILSGELEVGSKLPPERVLAESLGVSRVSIRQALHELQSRGLIDRRPGRGTIVLSATIAANAHGASIANALVAESREITDVMELRAIIEPPIAALTAARATPRDVAQLRGLVDQMSMDISVASYAELDRSFHQAIAHYTHNPLLSMLTEQIATLIAPSRDSSLQTKQRRRNSTEEHRRILEAIAAHDPDAAEKCAVAHIESITAEVLRATLRNEAGHASTAANEKVAL
jgi:GntR family transcriptional repressor for pyruvate dehydrogenase complex